MDSIAMTIIPESRGWEMGVGGLERFAPIPNSCSPTTARSALHPNARHLVTLLKLQLWVDIVAQSIRPWAARVEAAAARNIGRVGRFALKDHVLAFAARVEAGDDREQCLCIGVQRLIQYRAGRADLDDPA